MYVQFMYSPERGKVIMLSSIRNFFTMDDVATCAGMVSMLACSRSMAVGIFGSVGLSATSSSTSDTCSTGSTDKGQRHNDPEYRQMP